MNGEMSSRNMDAWQFLAPWMSTTGLTFLLLVIPAAFLAVYCHAEQVPYPMVGVGLAAFLGAMFLFFVICLLMFMQLLFAPALLTLAFLPSTGGKGAPVRHVISWRIYLWWFGVPLLLACALFWAVVTEDISGMGNWLWLLVPGVGLITSWYAAKLLATRPGGPIGAFSLSALQIGWLFCVLMGVVVFTAAAKSRLMGVSDCVVWALLSCFVVLYAAVIYWQSTWPPLKLSEGKWRSKALFGCVMLIPSAVLCMQTGLSNVLVGQFLKLLNRGGGIPVELVLDAHAAHAEGLVGANAVAEKLRCRASLLLDLGEEVNVKFAGFAHVTHFRELDHKQIVMLKGDKPDTQHSANGAPSVEPPTCSALADIQ